MKKFLLTLSGFVLFSIQSFSQGGNVGIGTANPQSKLEVNGSFATKINTVTGAVTLDGTYSTVVATPGSGYIITLPTIATSIYRIYTIVYNGTSGGNTITIQAASGENIAVNGVNSNTFSLTGGTLTLQNDGTVWRASTQAPSSGSGSYIQNNNVDGNIATGQSANFDITGNSEIGGTTKIGGNVGIGVASNTSNTLDVNGGSGAANTNGTNINLQAQNGGAGTAFGGGVSINSGAGTGGNASGNVSINNISSGNVNIATGNNDQTVNVNTGTANKITTIGSANGTSATTINAGSGGVKVSTLGTGLVKSTAGVLGNGVIATDVPTTISNSSSTNTLTTTVNGVTGTGVNIINSNSLGLSTNTLTSTVNGVAATSNAVSGVSNTSSVNSLSTTVNGVTGSSVNMINSNALGLSGTTITSTVNGVASSGLDIAPAIAAKEPWNVGGGTTPATTNTQNIYQNGKVGVGDFSGAAPTTDLQIGSTSLGTYSGIAMGAAGNRDLRIGQDATHDVILAWKYNATATNAYSILENFGGSNPLALQSSGGNVGIGTVSPAQKLHVEVNSNSMNIPVLIRNLNGTENATTANGNNAVGIGFLNEGGGNWYKAAIVHERTGGYGIGKLHFLVNGTVDANPATFSDSRMTITSSGNVGIGTTTPNFILDINSTGAVKMPVGTTGTRPSSPVAGAIRFNTDTKTMEYYDGTIWVSSNMEQTPVGTIIPFAGGTIPSGWLACDGTSYLVTAYPLLQAAIGYAWGGSGANFNVPDLRGRFLRGVDGTAGNDPDKATRTAANIGGNTGNLVGSVQGDALATHTHAVSGNTGASGTLTTSSESGHTHSIPALSGTTDNQGTHNHGRSGTSLMGQGGYGLMYFSDGNNSPGNSTNAVTGTGFDRTAGEPDIRTAPRELGLSNDGGHTHTVTTSASTTGGGSSHNHTISSFTLPVSITAGNPSSTNTSENRPKNADVTYIIKATASSTTAVVSPSIPSSGGVLGQTLYNNGSAWIASSNLYHNGSVVGIGATTTTPPYQKLEIGGNGGLGFSGTGLNAADKKLYSPADGDLEWMTNSAAGVHGFAISHQGAKLVYLNIAGDSYLNGGNVGIGTTGPADKLYLLNSTNVRIGVEAQDQGYAGIHFINNSRDYFTGINTSSDRWCVFDNSASLERISLLSGGNVGIGNTSPSNKLDVTGNIRATGALINGGFDFVLGNGDQTTRGNSGASRALVKDASATLDVNYGGDFTGGTRIGSLTGTGTRKVYADASGLLSASTNSNIAYYKNAAGFTATYPGVHTDVLTTTSAVTSSLTVEAGDVVLISSTFGFRLGCGGGSGTDQPKFGFRITGSCGTIDLIDAVEFQESDNIGREYIPLAKNQIWVATCAGTIQVTLGIDWVNFDDNSCLADIILTATKY